LQIQFAKTVALGTSIGDVFEKTVGRVVIPIAYEILEEKVKEFSKGISE